MTMKYAQRTVTLLTRRTLMVGAGAMALLPAWTPAHASAIGETVKVSGEVTRRQQKAEDRLAAGAPLMDNDLVVTAAESFADLKLGSDTRVLLGGDTELLIDSFIAGQGGTLELGAGAMMFDRPEGLAKIDVSVRTTFGMIGVRGTKFFAGPSRGRFAVFVEHGKVAVTNGGTTREVGKGQGVEIASVDARPSEPVDWGKQRIREAYALVGAR
ncbi:FecR family protein [Metarhizobium album]|nr:FecR family protein [Rhizobium album]